MSQPLKSSCARRPSSRYTAGELAPPLWNWILMSRPMPADGTSRYSTGRPGREKAPAVAEPPTALTRPGSTAAAMAAIVSRRAPGAANLANETSCFYLSHLSYAARGYLSRTPPRARAVNHTLAWIPLFGAYLPVPSAVECRDQVWFQCLQLRAPVRPGVVTRGRKTGRSRCGRRPWRRRPGSPCCS